MANLTVTYVDMRDSANRLNKGEAEIETKLRELKSQVDALISGGYVTDLSSIAFGTSYEEFSTGATKTIHGLDGMSQYLKAAADALESTDTELAKALPK